jgi:Gpi18-like mannosyltransferase
MFGVFSLSLVIRILLSPFQGYEVDLSTFSSWFHTAADYGPRIFYEVTKWCDYPPFNVYIFWVFGSLAKVLSIFGKPSLAYVLKLPSNLFDVATAVLIYHYLKGKIDFKSSITTASFYAFNPATIFNTSIWGQFDAIYTFFLVLSLILIINRKPEYSVIAFTMGILSKPQSVALAPLFFYLVSRRKSWKGLITGFLTCAATTLLLLSPFKMSNPLEFLLGIYLKGYGGYPYTSVNAFNLWAFHGFWLPDSGTLLFIDFFTIGWSLFGAITFFSLYHLNKDQGDSHDISILFSAFTILFGFFMLPTRIHERYLFPVFSILTLTMPFLKQSKTIYVVLTLTYLSNLAYILAYLKNGGFVHSLSPIVGIASSVNLITFFYALILMHRYSRAKC